MFNLVAWNLCLWMFCFAHIMEDEWCFDQSFPRLKTLRYLDLRTKKQSKKHHAFVFGLNVNENVQHDTGSCFAFEEKQVEVTCWVFCPARKDEKQTFSHFFGVVLWTHHWAKNTRLAKWASTTGGFIEQELHLKPNIRNSTTCFWNPQGKMQLRETWGENYLVSPGKHVNLHALEKCVLLEPHPCREFFGAEKVCTMGTAIYRFSKKKRIKSQASNITRLSPYLPCLLLTSSANVNLW